MKKTSEKYQKLRAQWWDYSSNAQYFITICTMKKAPFFGEIVDQKMLLSDLGVWAKSCWYEIPSHFPFVELGSFVVMPDHIHGIIKINKPLFIEEHVESQNFATPHSYQESKFESNKRKNKFGPQSNNLASVIRGYKIGVTKKSKTICPNFKWQTLYYDHIIRNETDLKRIMKYIEDNPINWKKKKDENPNKYY